MSSPNGHASPCHLRNGFARGRVSLQQAVDICQRTNTAIYAFHAESSGDGPRTLATLADETGGRVFHDDDAGGGLDLDAIEQDLRSEYRLVYRPREMKHDGRFHSLAILGPDRAPKIDVRSGYYAPGDERRRRGLC